MQNDIFIGTHLQASDCQVIQSLHALVLSFNFNLNYAFNKHFKNKIMKNDLIPF